MKSKLPNLEYKGYKGVFRFISKKEGFEGRIYPPSNPTEALEYPRFRGRSKKYLQKMFEDYVDKIIAEELLSKNNAEWLRVNDYLSVCYVYNVLPDEFRKRVENNEFDKTLLKSVKGWDYEVPLYYITKAYDVLLQDFFIRDDLDGYAEAFDEDWEEEDGEKIETRTFVDTLRVHQEMKKLWKDLFDIDIDRLEVDFSQYNKHLPPNVTEDESFDYFHDVPDGLTEWVLEGLIFPGIDDSLLNILIKRTSCLIEYTARVLYEQEL